MGARPRTSVRAISTLRRALALGLFAVGSANCSASDLDSESSARRSAGIQGGPIVQPDSVSTWFGTWGTPSTGPAQVIHASLLRNGKILAVGGSQYNCCYYWGRMSTHLYDIATGSWTTLNNGPYAANEDAFCSGHAHDNLGRVVHAGGLLGGQDPPPQLLCEGNGIGIPKSARYDVGTGSWANLLYAPAQYYPTVVAGNGHMWLFSGNNGTNGIWANTYGTSSWSNFGLTSPGCSTYPRVHLLPDGRLFTASPKNCSADRRNYVLDAAAWTLTPMGTDVVPNDGGSYFYDGFHSSSVLMPLTASGGTYPSATVMLTGGQTYYKKDVLSTSCPTGGPGPCWVATEPRPTDTVDGVTFPVRRYQSIPTLLPTGQVVVTGGVYGGPEGQGADSTRVRAAEIYGTDIGIIWLNEWTLTNPAQVTRNYHSVALLLPDGRIWTAGSNKDGQGSDCPANLCSDGSCNGLPDNRERQVEIFSPWYVNDPGRPVITSWPSSMSANGQWYSIGVGNGEGNNIYKVALMRAGSVTHAFDSDQRLVWLDITYKTPSFIRVNAPYTTGAAPPGDYMLFILKRTSLYSAHIPSVGVWTRR